MKTKPCAVDLEDFQTAEQSDELPMTILSAEESKRSANMCIVACLRHAIQASDGHNTSVQPCGRQKHIPLRMWPQEFFARDHKPEHMQDDLKYTS